MNAPNPALVERAKKYHEEHKEFYDCSCPATFTIMASFAEEVSQSQYNEICEWQRRIFTKATPLSCANHLKEEVDELITDLTNQETGLSEIADCFLLLIGVCNMKGLSHSDVVQLIETKMKINRERQWGEVNEKGYVKHIETHPSDGGKGE